MVIKIYKVYFDRYCKDCGCELPDTMGGGAKRCEDCKTVYRREYRREWAREFYKRKKSKKGRK